MKTNGLLIAGCVLASTPAFAARAVAQLTCASAVATSGASANDHSIEGYSNKLSAARGESISFHVHSPSPNYTVTIFRYGGTTSLNASITCGNGAVRNYASNAVRDSTYKDGLAWPASFSLQIPNLASQWPSGMYVARINDAVNGKSFDVTFVVKDPPAATKRIVVLASTNTWQAYNYWRPQVTLQSPANDGSFYDAEECGIPRRSELSFSRPNPYATPIAIDRKFEADGETLSCDYPVLHRTEHLTAGEVRVLRWLEANGFAYSMITDSDLDAQWTTILDSAKVRTLVISTHSEYWSDKMYFALTNYLLQGGNVLSMSGNTIYRRVTLGTNALGRPTITKVIGDGTPPAAPVDQPGYQWDTLPPLPLIPKRNLLGFLMSGGAATDYCIPFTVKAATHWAFAGISGVTANSPIGQQGEIAPNSTRCLVPSGSSGAAGEELDYATPAFAREYNVLGVANTGDGFQANIIHMRRASAGQVFTIGSITAGSTLSTDVKMSGLVKNALQRLSAATPAGFRVGSFSDFSGDGFTDVLGVRSDGSLRLYEGNGGGQLKPGTGIVVDTGWSQFDALISSGDMDSDGHADLLARKPDGSVWLYRGTGTPSPDWLVQTAPTQVISTANNGWKADSGTCTPPCYRNPISPGDFDSDGRPDVLVVKRPNTSAARELVLYRGTGSGGFQAPLTLGTGLERCGTGAAAVASTEMLSPGDFDEDGHPDLICRDVNGNLWLYAGTGSAAMPVVPTNPFDSGWASVRQLIAGGDYDSDGHGDLLAVTSGGANQGQLLLYPGAGDGTLEQGAGQLVDSGYDTLQRLFSVW